MPLPELIHVYGQTNLVAAFSPNPNIGGTLRVGHPRTVLLHVAHGWVYQATNQLTFWLDLDGTLYQNNELNREHMSARPRGPADPFNIFDPNPHNYEDMIGDTSIPIEMIRFGMFRNLPDGRHRIEGLGKDAAGNLRYIYFDTDNTNPEWCDYNAHGATSPGPHRFNLWKIPGGDNFEAQTRQYYKVRAARFNDARNPERPQYEMDILFTEEQYKTLVLWLKAMLETSRIPKQFLRDPTTGRENPWIDVNALSLSGSPTAKRAEATERMANHQGIWGHMNIQGNRVDPGASLDYYRLKRAISDHWWYPINLDDQTRAINYLDAARSADYLALTEYRDADQLEAYYRLTEDAEGGYFPIGTNMVWHGGIHLNTGVRRQVYAMANGWIVAARVTNGTVGGHQVDQSRCFVLIKHYVHTQDAGNEISYGANSTHIVYSLYMHLEPTTLNRIPDAAGGQRWTFDYDTMPKWLCHFLIDNPTHATLHEGGLIYPNQKVELSDHLGWTGNYYIKMTRPDPVEGITLHLEVFTTENPTAFAGNPWTVHQIIDPTPANLTDEAQLNDLIHDAGGDNIDEVDLKNASTKYRQHALCSRSTWSLDNRNQLGSCYKQWTDTDADENWNLCVRPLCFHADIRADPAAPAAEIGPYFNNTTVWQFHPLTFMRWMNERVDRHEALMAEQDKPWRQRPASSANVTVNDGYVVGFLNPTQLPRKQAGTHYNEVRFQQNTFEVTQDVLADQAALANAPQTATRFNLLLLDALDLCNDTVNFQVVEGYVSTNDVSCSDASRRASHRNGDAVDLRPAVSNMQNWYALYEAAVDARTYISESDDQSLELRITADTVGGIPGEPAQNVLDQEAVLLHNRLETAVADRDPNHPDLSAQPALQHHARMRLHIGLPPVANPTQQSVNNVRWLNNQQQSITDAAVPDGRLIVEAQVAGFAEGVDVEIFMLGESVDKTGTHDIRDIETLEATFGSRTFNLDLMKGHATHPGRTDVCFMRIKTAIGGPGSNGIAIASFDWQLAKGAFDTSSVDTLPLALKSIYPVCIVPSGAARADGTSSTEHTVGVGASIPLPHIIRTFWTSNETSPVPEHFIGYQSHDHAFVMVETAGLPSGCEIQVVVLNQQDNSTVLTQKKSVAAGTNTTSFRCAAPTVQRDYFANVTLTKPTAPVIRQTDGELMSWLDQ